MVLWNSGPVALGQLGNAATSGEVQLFGDGHVEASMMMLPDIARLTVAILDDPNMANKEVRLTANVTDQEGMIATWEKLSGKEVNRKSVSKDDLNQLIEQSTTPETFGQRIFAQLHRSIWINGDCMKKRPDVLEATEQYPDIPVTALEGFFSGMLAS